MLLREVPQRADDLADAVPPFLQGLTEFLEPVLCLRRSLPVGGVQRLFQMLQGVPAVQHLGRAWKRFLAEAPIVRRAVGDEHNLKVRTKTETVLRFCDHIPLQGHFPGLRHPAVAHSTQARPGCIVQRNRSRRRLPEARWPWRIPLPGRAVFLAHPEHGAINGNRHCHRLRRDPLLDPDCLQRAILHHVPGRTHRRRKVVQRRRRRLHPAQFLEQPLAILHRRQRKGKRSLPGGKGRPELADQAEPRIRRKHRSAVAAPILAPLIAHPAEGTHQLPRRLPGAVIHRAIQNQTVPALVQFLDRRAQQGAAHPVQRSRNRPLIRFRTVLTSRIRQRQRQKLGAKGLQRCIQTRDQLRARGSGLGRRKRQ